MSKTEERSNPQAINIEKSILASCLVIPDTVPEIIESLDIQAFYRTSHSIYFEAIKHLFDLNAPIDVTSIAQYIRDKKLETKAPLTELAAIMDEPVSVNLSFHIRILKEKAALRRGIEICNAGMKRCYDSAADAQETLDYLKDNIGSLEIDESIEEATKPVSELADETSERYRKIASGEVPPGIDTGFDYMDKYLSGLKPSDVMFIAARPSMGKTAMQLNIALNCHKKVAIFSLEQSKEQLMDRFVSMITLIDLSRITNMDLNEIEFVKVRGALRSMNRRPIIIDDTPALTVAQIRARSKRIMRQYGLDMIMVDYLQLMKPDFRKDGNRNLEVGKMAQGLKALAKELKIPIIINSQLNRSLENRPNPHKVPKLSDLRDSGEIEQVADVVAFLYRPSVYNDMENIKFDNQANFILAKHRQGPIGIDRLLFRAECVKFENVELYREVR